MNIQAAHNSLSDIQIELPFTLEFDITRKLLGSASTALFRIYNLSPERRNQLLINQWSAENDFRLVTLNAGYGPGPAYPLVFNGWTSRGWSVREGNNFISQLECFDGGNAYINATIDETFKAGTPYQVIIETLIARLLEFKVSRGTIGTFTGSTTRGYSASGSIVQILSELTGGAFYIDNGVANALGFTEAIGSNLIPVINASSGLLNTPVRETNYLHFEMLFEPKLVIGQLVNLQSATEPSYNGQYQVRSVHHKGVISGAVCGEAITTVELFYSTVFTQVGGK